MKIQAKKSLGQNFLKDENVLNKIVNSCNINENDLIIEIGPGKGALTQKLKSFNCDLLAFEIDERLREYLNKLQDERTTIIFNDFMKVNLSDYINKDYDSIHVVANIPYYITNPIIKKILDSDINIKDVTLMVQKEVADRLSSTPGHKTYGALTIFANIDYNVSKLFDVSKYSFDPVPKVDSSVIRFNKRREKLNIKNMDKFSLLINNSFQNKRKTLKNNLSSYNWEVIRNILQNNGYNEMVRAEQLPIEMFIKISNEM